jgi:two-component system cell cycle response regulator
LHKPFDQVARGGWILLVEDNDSSYRRIQDALRGEFELAREADPASALLRLPDGDFDLIIVSLSLRDADSLRLCSQVRSLDRARHLPLLIIVEPGDDAPLLKGLDMGVNDYVVRPIDPNELLARVRTQLKRKRYLNHLRRLEESVEMAILDPLTGLHNRRYMASHLATLFDDASRRGEPLSVLLIDIDHFKAVNDSHGHDAGDAVLREFATRIRRGHARHRSRLPAWRRGVRGVMPDCDLAKAYQVGERLRQCIEAAPFEVGGKVGLLQVTASVGVAALELDDGAPEQMLKRADDCAKRDGRTGLWPTQPRGLRPRQSAESPTDFRC